MSDAARGPPDARKGAQAPPSWQADCDPCTGAGVHAKHAIQVSWCACSAGTTAITALHGADCKLPAQHAGPHDGATFTKIIDLTMASADDDIIDLDKLPDDDDGSVQARSPLPPDTGRIVRSLHAHDEARVRKQMGTRLEPADIVIGQQVMVDDVVVG